MPSRSEIHRIQRPCFNIDVALIWTVALKRPIFKRKKGFRPKLLLHGLILATISWHCPFNVDPNICLKITGGGGV
jgi:hypothetical protein